MKNWKIGTRITVGFAAVIVATLILGGFAYSLVGSMQSSSREITVAALPGLYYVSQVQNSGQKNYSALLTMLACKDRQRAAQMEAAILNARAEDRAKVECWADREEES